MNPSYHYEVNRLTMSDHDDTDIDDDDDSDGAISEPLPIITSIEEKENP